MGEFFKGWRRKAGLVTLAMALAVLALWMRGPIYLDHFVVTIGQSRNHFTSCDGEMRWEPTVLNPDRTNKRPLPMFEWNSQRRPKNIVPTVQESTAWDWKMAGFYFGMDGSSTPHPIRIIRNLTAWEKKPGLACCPFILFIKFTT